LEYHWSVSLRERKAAKRKRIVDEGLRLFKRNGYEPTTMESIAEAAEVSPATLYRYFPSKDLILLDHFMTFFEGLPASFSKYAVDHPVDEALVKAVFAALRSTDENPEKALLVRSIVDRAPVPRARLFDLAYVQIEKMSRLLAEQLKLPKDDLRIELTVRMVHLITGVAGDRWRANGGRGSAVAYAKQVIKACEGHPIIWPVKSTRGNGRKPHSNSRRKSGMPHR
jgi:AcrR family transcriptional regulator